MVKRIENCFKKIHPSEHPRTYLVFTAHSIPCSDPHVEQYAQQIETTAKTIATTLGHRSWQIAYQSRSGRPQDPWLEPDVNDLLQDLSEKDEHIKNVIIAPIGFVCDNIEVLYDLGTEARATAKKLGLTFQLAKTVGAEPLFMNTLADLVIETISEEA
jgi:ferrochelatase